MTTASFVLVAAILILGGVIATVGDRIGTRVGKARLSLFKLRPRNTAVVVTILTGSIISASTLAILFATSEQLRTGVFELEKIQRDLRHKRQDLQTTRQQLEATTAQKTQVERRLAQARAEQKTEQVEAQKQQAEAQKRLEAINQSLKAAIAKQTQTQAKLSQITSQFQLAQGRLKIVSQQARVLRSEIQQLQAERQELIEQRNAVKAQIAQRDQAIAKLDQKISQRDQEILKRDQVIAQRETRLKELETQQDYLEQAVAKLERNFQVLRGGNVALSRGEVLAAGVVRIVEPLAARQAVEQLLREANRTAIEITQPSTKPVNEQVVLIPKGEVEQLIKQIDDGQDYVVRIRSAGNYVLGEKHVEVFADAALNQIVFTSGSILATITANPALMTVEELEQRVKLLLGASKFRAQRAGILSDKIQIGDGSIETPIRFMEKLKQYNRAVELKAVAAENTYTAGPLKVELVAVANGRVVFGTKSVSGQARGSRKTTPATKPPAPKP
jgi:uncharacterized protein (DUF3084 family)